MFVAINFSALCWGALKEYESIHETGATGNIGLEVGHFLSKLNFKSEILAAVLHIEKMKAFFKKYPDPFLHHFDYKVEDDEPKSKFGPFNRLTSENYCRLPIRKRTIKSMQMTFGMKGLKSTSVKKQKN